MISRSDMCRVRMCRRAVTSCWGIHIVTVAEHYAPPRQALPLYDGDGRSIHRCVVHFVGTWLIHSAQHKPFGAGAQLGAGTARLPGHGPTAAKDLLHRTGRGGSAVQEVDSPVQCTWIVLCHAAHPSNREGSHQQRRGQGAGGRTSSGPTHPVA